MHDLPATLKVQRDYYSPCRTTLHRGCLSSHDIQAVAMLASTRQWVKRNRANFAIGAGVLGAGYLAGQYVVSKFTEARQRMSDDRIAREKYVLCV